VSTYLNWNDVVAAHFFNHEMAGRQVYLYVTEELIARLGRRLGEDVQGFIAAVKTGPPWTTREGLCQRALQALHNWRLKGLPYPPYIGYLALFVLAAGTEGNFAPHAYYPRLNYLLGYPERGMLPSYNHMLELWDDLERWSTSDKKGEVGIFKARIVGNWIHVGLPIAQTVLTEQERRSLPLIFAEGGLDPTTTASPRELGRILKVYGAGVLGPRTLRLLETLHDEELYEVLLDTVAEELAEWDGQVEAALLATVTRTRTFAVMRLCLSNVDLVAGRLQSTLRFRLNRDFPEGRVMLTAPGLAQAFWCEEYLGGWSSPLRRSGGDLLVDAAQFNWAEGLVLVDERLGWRFRLLGRTARVFVDGIEDGLPGLVEVYTLPRARQFYLLYQRTAWPQLSGWSQEECRGFAEQRITEGLPAGWAFASVGEATGDTCVRDHFPSLSLPQNARLRLTGGIRSSAGNNFFSFALPDLYLEGGNGEEQVLCDGQVLLPTAGMQSYSLPPQLPIESKITIEVHHGSQVIRQSLYLTGDFIWRWSSPLKEFDRWGAALEYAGSELPRVAGAVVVGEASDLSRFRRPVFLARGLDTSRRGRVFFVGRRPGQIACWPADPIPHDWDPIWAIPFTRRGCAIYCGDDPVDSTPEADPIAQGRRVDLWKEVLWHDRKRIRAPDRPVLLKLWKQYVEAARNVR
jgi:hypothetical protein